MLPPHSVIVALKLRSKEVIILSNREQLKQPQLESQWWTVIVIHWNWSSCFYWLLNGSWKQIEERGRSNMYDIFWKTGWSSIKPESVCTTPHPKCTLAIPFYIPITLNIWFWIFFNKSVSLSLQNKKENLNILKESSEFGFVCLIFKSLNSQNFSMYLVHSEICLLRN